MVGVSVSDVLQKKKQVGPIGVVVLDFLSGFCFSEPKKATRKMERIRHIWMDRR